MSLRVAATALFVSALMIVSSAWSAAAQPGGQAPAGQTYPKLSPDQLETLNRQFGPGLAGCAGSEAWFMGVEPESKLAGYVVRCRDGGGVIGLFPMEGSTAERRTYFCYETLGTQLQCPMLTRQEALAPLLAAADHRVPECGAIDAKFVGAQETVSYYEIACSRSPGFVLQGLTRSLTLTKKVTCLRSRDSGLPCALPANAGAAEATARRYAERSGCRYVGARVLGEERGGGDRDIVELECSNKPFGVVVHAPESGGREPEGYDVERGFIVKDCLWIARGETGCQLTSRAELIAGLNALARRSQPSCQVVNFRSMGEALQGAYLSGRVLSEVLCANGTGLVMVTEVGGASAVSVERCGAGPAAGITCTLRRGG